MAILIRNMQRDDMGAIAEMLTTYDYGRYLQDPTLSKEGSRLYLLDSITDFFSKYPSTCFVAEENKSIIGMIGFTKSEWDTEHFGYNVSSIDFIISRKMGYEKELLVKKLLINSFNSWSKREKISFTSTRLDDCDLSSIHALESDGFRYIETMLNYSFDYRKGRKIEKSKYPLRPLKKEEVEVFVEIARSSFVENRFHFDPHFDREKANELYAKWLRNSYNNPSNYVTVLEIGKNPASFFVHSIDDLSKYFGLKFGRWILAAVSPDFRKRGIGYQHYLGILNLLKNQVDINDANFTLKNVPVVNLYIKLGFKKISSQVTLHKWM